MSNMSHIYQLMDHINVSKYIYYRQDDVKLTIAHQIQSRVAMSEGPGAGLPHSGLAGRLNAQLSQPPKIRKVVKCAK